jgi:hypothetical protein
MQNLHQSMWDYEMLYADVSSEDEQLLLRLLLRKTKNMNTRRQLKFKIHVLFYGDNS